MFTIQQLFELNQIPLDQRKNPAVTKAIAQKLNGMGLVRKLRKIEGKTTIVYLTPEEAGTPFEFDINNLKVPT